MRLSGHSAHSATVAVTGTYLLFHRFRPARPITLLVLAVNVATISLAANPVRVLGGLAFGRARLLFPVTSPEGFSAIRTGFLARRLELDDPEIGAPTLRGARFKSAHLPWLAFKLRPAGDAIFLNFGLPCAVIFSPLIFAVALVRTQQRDGGSRSMGRRPVKEAATLNAGKCIYLPPMLSPATVLTVHPVGATVAPIGVEARDLSAAVKTGPR